MKNLIRLSLLLLTSLLLTFTSCNVHKGDKVEFFKYNQVSLDYEPISTGSLDYEMKLTKDKVTFSTENGEVSMTPNIVLKNESFVISGKETKADVYEGFSNSDGSQMKIIHYKKMDIISIYENLEGKRYRTLTILVLDGALKKINK